MTNPWIVRYQHSWVSPHSQEWPEAHWTPGLPNSLHAWLGQRRAPCPKWWPAAQMKQDKHALGTAPFHACCHEQTPVDRQKFLRHAKIPCNNVNLCFEYERTREWHCVCFFCLWVDFYVGCSRNGRLYLYGLGSTTLHCMKTKLFLDLLPTFMCTWMMVKWVIFFATKNWVRWILLLGVEERRFQIPTFCFISVQANPKGSHVKWYLFRWVCGM